MCTVAQEALNNLAAVSAVSSRVATSRRRAVTAGTSVELVSGTGGAWGCGFGHSGQVSQQKGAGNYCLFLHDSGGLFLLSREEQRCRLALRKEGKCYTEGLT